MTEEEVAECFTKLLGLNEVDEEGQEGHGMYTFDGMQKKNSPTNLDLIIHVKN